MPSAGAGSPAAVAEGPAPVVSLDGSLMPIAAWFGRQAGGLKSARRARRRLKPLACPTAADGFKLHRRQELRRQDVATKDMPTAEALAGWVDEREPRFIMIADAIWRQPQVALTEAAAC